MGVRPKGDQWIKVRDNDVLPDKGLRSDARLDGMQRPEGGVVGDAIGAPIANFAGMTQPNG